MSDQGLELVFYGELEPGADMANTRSQMAQLFKVSAEQIDRMFSGQRVVLKSRLDQATADKYLQALKARGAACKIEPIGGASAQPTAQSAAPVSEQEQVTDSVPDSARSQPSAASHAAAPKSGQTQVQSQGSESGLPIAGEKVDEVLAHSHLAIDPVGVDLTDEHDDTPPPDLKMQDSLSIAPAGSDLGQEKEEVEASVPDTSHIKLDD